MLLSNVPFLKTDLGATLLHASLIETFHDSDKYVYSCRSTNGPSDQRRMKIVHTWRPQKYDHGLARRLAVGYRSTRAVLPFLCISLSYEKGHDFAS